MKKLEKEIVKQIMKYLKSLPNCFAFKTHGGMYGVAGIPDIIVCYEGRFIAFEVKTEKGKTTKLQDVTLDKIKKANGKGVVVRSLDEVKSLISEI